MMARAETQYLSLMSRVLYHGEPRRELAARFRAEDVVTFPTYAPWPAISARVSV